MNKPAVTQFEIHDAIKNRWSPRAYSSRPVEQEKLHSILEAARWAASGGNAQPWAFIVVTRDNQPLFQQIVEATTGRNPLWMKDVPVIILSLAKLNPERPGSERFAYYAVGQSVANLSIEATHQGLHVHQVAGFDAAKVSAITDIPEGYQLMTLIAVGYLGNIDDLANDSLRADELADRSRKPLSEFVFGERFNQPLPIADADPELAGN